VKLERKELTKSYDISGYWNGSYTGTDKTYDAPPLPNDEVHPENLALTTDIGGFLQGVADYDIVRLIGEVRYDINSLYGASFNPRASAIFNAMDDQLAIKAIYGEAFQEPAPIQLWGGWSGRSANPDLEPEKARNFELAGIFQTPAMTNELSAYRAQYTNVIKEETENAGERTITGLEYRARLELNNPPPESDRISLYANYTFTNSISSVKYDHDAGEWVNGETALGDIAPHKANLGVVVQRPCPRQLGQRAGAVHPQPAAR
jgi:outer membrane receptor for ferrienterochelin and colicins